MCCSPTRFHVSDRDVVRGGGSAISIRAEPSWWQADLAAQYGEVPARWDGRHEHLRVVIHGDLLVPGRGAPRDGIPSACCLPSPAYRREHPVEVLTTRPARAQVSCDA